MQTKVSLIQLTQNTLKIVIIHALSYTYIILSYPSWQAELKKETKENKMETYLLGIHL